MIHHPNHFLVAFPPVAKRALPFSSSQMGEFYVGTLRAHQRALELPTCEDVDFKKSRLEAC